MKRQFYPLNNNLMKGAIIGDIVGSRFEFNNHLSTDFQLFTDDCAFTDDTICTVAVADALLKGIPFPDALRNWCARYPSPKGSYGGSFGAWLRAKHPEPYNSYGNGSAMRVSPCAWFSNNREDVLKWARQSAECTHNHPEGIRGALYVADAIFQARTGASKAALRQLATETYGYSLPSSCNAIRETNTFNETCQVTVPQALVCVLESADFEHAIRLAVSIGGDTDTLAAIAGSIAEGLYGVPPALAEKALSYLTPEMRAVITKFV